MSDSMFGSLLNMLDKRSIRDVGSTGSTRAIGLAGMESSIAALLEMASKPRTPARCEG